MSGDWPQVIYRLQIGPAPDPAWRRLPSPACERVVIKEQVAMRVLTSKKNERSDQQEGGRNGPLLTVYSEVSKAHASIMEFRAKLLTLLPLASGTGIFLVLQGNIPGFKPEYMIAAGVFGVLITLGLYLYEITNIRWCGDLWYRGSMLEQIIFEREAESLGLFHGDPEALGGFVSSRGAALMIFPVTLGAWIYVAVTGLTAVKADSLEAWVAGVASVSAFLVVLLGGWWFVRDNEFCSHRNMNTLGEEMGEPQNAILDGHGSEEI
jgi:hypothetical protein